MIHCANLLHNLLIYRIKEKLQWRQRQTDQNSERIFNLMATLELGQNQWYEQ